MPRIHETLTGHRIEYPDPDPKLEKFLRHVTELAADPAITEDELIAVIYGRDNPILSPSIFQDRGAVTREVLDNPVYQVLTDLLARKHARAAGITPEKLARPFTLTVAEAAAQLGVTEDAVRKAARDHRLPSLRRDGQYFFNPKTLHLFVLGKRGPLPANTEPLEYRVGSDHASQAMLKLKVPGGTVELDPEAKAASRFGKGEVARWRRVGVLTGSRGKLRFFVLEPAGEPGELELHGFYVRGRFRIAQKINNTAEARKAWEAFTAA